MTPDELADQLDRLKGKGWYIPEGMAQEIATVLRRADKLAASKVALVKKVKRLEDRCFLLYQENERLRSALAHRSEPTVPPTLCEWPEPGTIGAETHCIHWLVAYGEPCCWCGNDDESDRPPCPAVAGRWNEPS